MNSRERILTAINHEEPDKVPIDSWLAPEVAEVLIESLSLDVSEDPFALQKALGNDLLYYMVGFCDGFSSIFKEERKIGKNLYQDPWGIKWRKKSQQYGSYCEFAEHPLANIKNYDNYKFPDPLKVHESEFEIYRELLRNEGKEFSILGAVACSMLEASWYLRGLENFMMDIVSNKDFATDLLDKTMSYSLTISKKLVEMGVDIIWWGDDIAMEQGPLVSPKIFRELLKPRYAYMIQEVKKINKNIKTAFHTDGKIEWALDDFVEIGMDIINPLQPDVNDSTAVKKKYGKKLTFWGNVDTRKVMSEGTFKDVAEEVKNCISTLSPGGGHILCSNDNTIAFYYMANKFRDYPIKITKSKSGQKLNIYFT